MAVADDHVRCAKTTSATMIPTWKHQPVGCSSRIRPVFSPTDVYVVLPHH